ncbi:metal ABC transporter ATP-binding protein [Spirulina major CS-329]|uniref:metal ABC transporter ATP-binding protein n=1 Tax=Spirulina TaxID=1154 RepID=UPI00232F2144|nr:MULTISPECIES: metal ABC transporter ATP-binding protein [Spirulina]MDB9496413.1 metal ABC transporter ATP-binding protein [Spirulina subsalsa CS-330]MDB9504376.1 metal ABC transporter ATP-binding protein [Spirulina major CS-329]
MSKPVLVIDGLTVYRETHLAVEQVSFAVQPGTDTAIIGPNGAGKSTLIQAVLGIVPRQSGDVFVLGCPLSFQGNLPDAVRQRIAYLPQHFWLDRRIPITVSELVGLGWDRMGLQLPWVGRRTRHQAVRNALAQVEAWHLRDQRVSSLSGGETKRVLLAYCLVRPRSLLILDEAPAGLDLRSESDFYQLLYQLKQEQGWAILQISHDLGMVRRNCDHVLCLNRKLLCQGTPDHALAPEQLSLAYGSEFVRYHHTCQLNHKL